MRKVLFAWIGMADLAASRGDSKGNVGPIGQAVRGDAYPEVVLLSDHDQPVTKKYLAWLRPLCDGQISAKPHPLSSPVAFGEIYEAATGALKEHIGRSKIDRELVFHLSPGTPAMAAVWIILSKTRFPATLIESSREHGVRMASVPFDISADYIPDLLRKPDEDLVRLSQGLSPEAPEFQDIIHRSAVMKRLIAKARRVAPRNIPVLILGPSGTGKELLARAIHNSSPRKDAPFVAVNCGALPHELIESELFGHEKGAFTGAVAVRKGYIEEAHQGTLFLDEVGDLPLHAQVKLLRVLQDGRLHRVGSSKSIFVDVRIVSATNRELVNDVVHGAFREDFFHRIAVAVLHVPALRDREGDLGLLIDSLLAVVNREAAGQPGYQDKKLSASARNLLLQHSWPGNVRELLNTLQRAAIWSTGPTIDATEVREALLPMPKSQGDQVLGQPLGDGFSLPDIMQEVARHYLDRALIDSGGNKTRAAELVGLPSYQTLTNWLRRFGLENS